MIHRGPHEMFSKYPVLPVLGHPLNEQYSVSAAPHKKRRVQIWRCHIIRETNYIKLIKKELLKTR